MGWSFTYFSTKPELRPCPRLHRRLARLQLSPARRPDALTAVLLPETTKEWHFVIFHFHDSNGCWNKVLHINKYRQVPDWGHGTNPFFLPPQWVPDGHLKHLKQVRSPWPQDLVRSQIFPKKWPQHFGAPGPQMSLFCRWSSASKEFFLGKFGGRGCRCTHLMVWLLMIVKIIYTSLLERCRVVHAKKDAHLADKWTCNVMHSPLNAVFPLPHRFLMHGDPETIRARSKFG